jgi:hypothetical protein
VLLLIELLHDSFGKIVAIVCNDAMWISKMIDQLFEEFNSCSSITAADWLCLNPLSELVNCNQQMSVLILGSLERSNHIKPPDYKGLGYRNHPQLLSRHMSLTRKFLTTITLADNILCICMSHKPVNTMPKGFHDQ